MDILKNVRKQVDQLKLNREIEQLSRLVQENPQNAEALRRLAETYQAANNVDAAISHFIQLADLYRQTKQHELALAFYRKVERMVDSDHRATILKQMINIYFELKQFDRAYEHCRQVITLYIAAQQPEAATGFMKMLPEFGEKDADYRKELREMIQERDEKWMQGAKATWVDTGAGGGASGEENFSDRLILLVDDEPHVLMILEKIIRPLGCQIITANNGVEALEKARQQTPSIIISDLMMPKMDGSQLFATLQDDEVLSAVPFVCLTSRDQEDEKISAFEKGVEDYWSKPFSVKEIPVRVKRLLRRTKPVRPAVGQLAATSVVDLLNQFERERKTGLLQMVSPSQEKASIYFREGTPVDAELGAKRGLQVIFTVVGWNDGSFRFLPQPVNNQDVIKMRASDLILEALRRFDEEQELMAQLPDLQARAVPPAGFSPNWYAHISPDLVRKVLSLIDGTRTIGDCVARCDGDLDQLRILAALWSPEIRKTLLPPEPQAPPPPPPPLVAQPLQPNPSGGYPMPGPEPLTPPAPPMNPGYGGGMPPMAVPPMSPQPGPPQPGGWAQSGMFPSADLFPQAPPQQPGNWGQSGTYPTAPDQQPYPPQGYPGYPQGYPPSPYPGYSGGYPSPYGSPYGAPPPYPPSQMPQYPAYPPGTGYPGVPQQPGYPGGYPGGTVPQPPGYPGQPPQMPSVTPSSPPQSPMNTPSKPAGGQSSGPVDVSIVFQDPQSEVQLAQKLYEAVVLAKRQCGEAVDEFTFQRFHRILVEQSSKIKGQLNCPRVVFSVQVEGGRVKFIGKGA